MYDIKKNVNVTNFIALCKEEIDDSKQDFNSEDYSRPFIKDITFHVDPKDHLHISLIVVNLDDIFYFNSLKDFPTKDFLVKTIMVSDTKSGPKKDWKIAMLSRKSINDDNIDYLIETIKPYIELVGSIDIR